MKIHTNPIPDAYETVFKMTFKANYSVICENVIFIVELYNHIINKTRIINSSEFIVFLDHLETNNLFSARVRMAVTRGNQLLLSPYSNEVFFYTGDPDKVSLKIYYEPVVLNEKDLVKFQFTLQKEYISAIYYIILRLDSLDYCSGNTIVSCNGTYCNWNAFWNYFQKKLLLNNILKCDYPMTNLTIDIPTETFNIVVFGNLSHKKNVIYLKLYAVTIRGVYKMYEENLYAPPFSEEKINIFFIFWILLPCFVVIILFCLMMCLCLRKRCIYYPVPKENDSEVTKFFYKIVSYIQPHGLDPSEVEKNKYQKMKYSMFIKGGNKHEKFDPRKIIASKMSMLKTKSTTQEVPDLFDELEREYSKEQEKKEESILPSFIRSKSKKAKLENEEHQEKKEESILPSFIRSKSKKAKLENEEHEALTNFVKELKKQIHESDDKKQSKLKLKESKESRETEKNEMVSLVSQRQKLNAKIQYIRNLHKKFKSKSKDETDITTEEDPNKNEENSEEKKEPDHKDPIEKAKVDIIKKKNINKLLDLKQKQENKSEEIKGTTRKHLWRKSFNNSDELSRTETEDDLNMTEINNKGLTKDLKQMNKTSPSEDIKSKELTTQEQVKQNIKGKSWKEMNSLKEDSKKNNQMKKDAVKENAKMNELTTQEPVKQNIKGKSWKEMNSLKEDSKKDNKMKKDDPKINELATQEPVKQNIKGRSWRELESLKEDLKKDNKMKKENAKMNEMTTQEPVKQNLKGRSFKETESLKEDSKKNIKNKKDPVKDSKINLSVKEDLKKKGLNRNEPDKEEPKKKDINKKELLNADLKEKELVNESSKQKRLQNKSESQKKDAIKLDSINEDSQKKNVLKNVLLIKANQNMKGINKREKQKKDTSKIESIKEDLKQKVADQKEYVKDLKKKDIYNKTNDFTKNNKIDDSNKSFRSNMRS